MKEMGTKVLPVFYHVDPSEVRRQTGEHFGKAFEKHQKRYKKDPIKVQRWKDSLFQVGNLSGWHLQDGSESKVIQEIVEKVFTEMNKIISTSEGLVGMDSHLNELFPYLNIGGLDVRIIGICGMGGIGKTTIAQVVFERLRAQFEGDSFLESVKHETEKQGSTIHLQEKLLLNLLNTNVNVQNPKMGKDIIKHRLSTKRVLVVLDDVDQDIQLETLCHRTWFGPGSRIIITSRDEHLISAFGADKIYMVNALTDPEAFDLFRLKAFNEDETGEDFLKLSNEFLKYANGLPLAIKVLGSSVRGRNVKLWSSALKRLAKNPPKGIIDVLKVSFDGLEETEKKTFLDIACFFKGVNKDRVIRILDGCDDAGVEMDVQVLIDRSLVTLFGTKLWMHDLIQEMGQEVVCQECREDPGKRSRLWLPKDIIRVLDQSKATSAVQSIFLQCPTEDDVVHSIGNAYSNMDRLRLLKISNVRFSGNIRYLSNELQYLEWHECASDSFPSDFHPEKLVELHMRFSGIKQLWRGRKGWSMLRLIDLSGSEYLMSTPDFTEVPDLETLVLQDCTSLVEIHPSLGFLKKLVSLNMRNCKSIESIPLLTTLESLQIMRLSLCSGLKKFPEIQGNMKSLMELHLDGTSIEELPPSIEYLTGLTVLNLTDCKYLLRLPNTIGCLTSLKILYLTGCSNIDEMPENLHGMKCLDKLSIGGTSIRELSVLRGMKNLQYLSCRGCKCLVSETCKGLASLSSLIELDLSYCNLMDGDFLNYFSTLIYLTFLDLRGNCFVRLPESISQLSKLDTLNLSNCRELQLVPKKLPLSLRKVFARDCISLKDYPNQIKVLNSSESGETTIISLNSSVANFTDTTELHLTDLAFMKLVYSFWSDTTICVVLADEIPGWFSTVSTRNPISIRLTDDNNWMGIAACAVFSVKGHTTLIETDADSSNSSYQLTLETDVVRLKPLVLDGRQIAPQYRSRSHLLVIFNISRSRFPQMALNGSTVVRAIFETTNPSMVVQKCGIRTVYEKDVGWNERIVEEDLVCLNEMDDGVSVPQSAFLLNQNMKWEKFSPPLEEESTLVLRKNLESVLPRYLEALNSDSAVFKFNMKGSPGWFHVFYPDVRLNSTRVSMKLPQNLHKDKKWMGFVIFASLVEEVEQTMKEDGYQVYVELSVRTMFLNLEHIRPFTEEHHRLLVIYIPRAEIPEANAVNLVIGISTLHVKVQRCGFRMVYQEDLQGFADTIIRCMQTKDALKYYDKLVVGEWIRLIRLQGAHLERMTKRDSRSSRDNYFVIHSRKYRNWDWSDPRPVFCDFEGAQIFKTKWIMPFINQGNSAEIRLPLNVFDDSNWLGFAVCYRFSQPQYPKVGSPEQDEGQTSSTAPDSENVMVTLRLDSGLFDFKMPGSLARLPLSVLGPLEYDATRFVFIPRTKCLVNETWSDCKLARVTMWYVNPCLAVHSCALRLVFKEKTTPTVPQLLCPG